MIASFSTMLGEVSAKDGPVAIIAQSGAMSVVPYALLRSEGVGVRHAHATGNECDLTVADLAWAVAGDPAVKLILLYLESLPDPQALARAACRAAVRGVPVLALKAGISARGQAAASSHTGAVATEDRVVDAFMRQHGIVRVPDMRSLVRSARLWLQADLPGAAPHGLAAGRRVAAISNSGACCVMAADAAERHGLDMAPFAPGTRDAIAEVMPPFASAANPVDLTAALLSDSGLFGRVLPLVAHDNAADSYFISLPMSGKGYDVGQFADDAARFRAATGKPVVVCSPLPATRRTFEEAGIVTFEHDEDAMAALSEFVHGCACILEARRLTGLSTERLLQPTARAGATAPAPIGQFLSEHDSLAILAGIGIPVVPHALCRSVMEVESATTRLQPPWAVKACSAAIPHKSDYGLVRLGIATPQEAVAAFQAFETRCRALGKPIEGVIVAPMQRAQRELMLGARWDDRFGAIVIAGDGGKYVEAMPDVVTAIHPFDADHFEALLDGLRMARLWRGVRNEQPLPRRALANAAVSLAHWVHGQGGSVLSVDVNPLMAGPGDTLYAVDALVERAAPTQ
jgi:acyl-CoA synthetase (NDP forming)